VINSKIVNHKLTHKNLSIEINLINIDSKKEFEKFASDNDFLIVNETQADENRFQNLAGFL
jgi:A/G-specific adenine glycosylase